MSGGLLCETVIHQPVEVHPLVRGQLPGLGHDRLQPLQGLLLHHRGAVPGVDLPVPGAHPLQNVQVRVRELVTDGLRHLAVRVLRHPLLGQGHGVDEALDRLRIRLHIAAVGKIRGIRDLAAFLADGAQDIPLPRLLHLGGGGLKQGHIVPVAAGEGLKAVFTDLAADAVVSGGQTMNPATEDILAAIQSVPAKTVFVLPNNKNIIMAAEQAQKLADRQVVVLPTRTVPMGITAMLNFDPSVNAETNTINMMAAADKVSTGLITYAARDSEYDGKRIRKGEIMALENGKIVSTSNDITKATYRLARGMCKKDSSFVTIISGCDVSDEEAEKVTELVKAKCPNHVEVSHIRGGQPVYYYMISVE